MDPVDVLSFLFTLGSLELGTSYSTSNLTATQLQMLEDLSDLGLIFHPEKSDRYYPTRLATTLTSDAPALLNSSHTSTTTTLSASTTDDLAASANEKGFIILETNYRLYAYTNSLA